MEETGVKRNVVIINIVTALLWMSMYAYAPILPAYAEDLGASAAMIGLISGSYGIMQVALRLPLGIIADRSKKDRFWLAAGFAVTVASCLVFVLFKGVIGILIGRILSGAAAAWWVTLSVFAGRCYSEERQITSQGTLNTSASAGKFISALLCGIVARVAGYDMTFVFALIFGVFGLLLSLGYKPMPCESKEQLPPRYWLSLLKNKPLMIFSLLCMLIHVLAFAVPSTFSLVAAKAIGADSLQLGVMTFIFFAGGTVGCLFIGTKPYARLGGINTVAICFVLSAVSCIPQLYRVSLPLIYVMQFAAGVSFAVSVGILSGWTLRSVPGSARGIATGLFQSLFSIGVFIGPVIAGAIVQAVSFDAAYWAMFAIAAAGAALCYLLVPRAYDKMT